MDKYSFKEMNDTILKGLVDEKEEEYLSKKRAKELFDRNIFLKYIKRKLSRKERWEDEVI